MWMCFAGTPASRIRKAAAAMEAMPPPTSQTWEVLGSRSVVVILFLRELSLHYSRGDSMSDLSLWLQAARENWHWQRQARPSFAQIPPAEQESVWDYPRPPPLLPDSRE